ncbi:MAG: DUF6691 family protein [Myxococcota bacterium]
MLASALSGLLFGAGLAVSGMTRPDQVIAFLDLSDAWDPGLALVMASAVAVYFVASRRILRRRSPLFVPTFGVPVSKDLDVRLVGGSALFGVGWAIGGYCPGPGLVSAATGGSEALLFVGTMSAGMVLHQIVDEAWRGRTTPVPPGPEIEPDAPPIAVK